MTMKKTRLSLQAAERREDQELPTPNLRPAKKPTEQDHSPKKDEKTKWSTKRHRECCSPCVITRTQQQQNCMESRINQSRKTRIPEEDVPNAKLSACEAKGISVKEDTSHLLRCDSGESRKQIRNATRTEINQEIRASIKWGPNHDLNMLRTNGSRTRFCGIQGNAVIQEFCR